MKDEEFKTLISRIENSKLKTERNPNKGHERGLVYPFDLSNLSQALRRLADEIDREQRENGYSPIRININRDMTDRHRYRAEIVLQDKRWYV